MSLERYRRELGYDHWANHEVLHHLQRESSPPARCIAWFAHVLGAQSLWLARLEGTKSELSVWPQLTLDELEPWLARLQSGWSSCLDRLGPADLARSISYVNTRGEPWESRVDDVLTQVLFHGVHHRGQIASALREAGLTPPVTDYIHAVRSGKLAAR